MTPYQVLLLIILIGGVVGNLGLLWYGHVHQGCRNTGTPKPTSQRALAREARQISKQVWAEHDAFNGAGGKHRAEGRR